MIHKNIKNVILLSALICLSSALPVLAEQAKMFADNITFNTKTKLAHAVGNVVIKRGTGTLWGETADGDINKSEFYLRGNVRGEFLQHNSKLKAQSVKWKKSGEGSLVEAFDGVYLEREPSDKLKAQYVKWEPDTENYSAKGNVDGIVSSKYVLAEEVGRQEEKFWGNKVKRYEDLIQKTALAANRVDGIIKNNVVQSMIALGSVKLDSIDNAGLKTIVTGEKLVYQKSLGTIVVTGNPYVTRDDGKNLKADKIIVYEQTKNIETIGNSTVVFDLKDNKKPKNTKKSVD
ncbi:MAG: hypothetical protein RR272_04680 [Synergistaceae bacterium]